METTGPPQTHLHALNPSTAPPLPLAASAITRRWIRAKGSSEPQTEAAAVLLGEVRPFLRLGCPRALLAYGRRQLMRALGDCRARSGGAAPCGRVRLPVHDLLVSKLLRLTNGWSGVTMLLSTSVGRSVLSTLSPAGYW